ncbi:MAG TPA: SDR family NAD(P)-dependent oxidoreductase [Waterburya sp.]
MGVAIVALLQEVGTKVAYTDIKITEGKSTALGVQVDVTNLASMEAAATQIQKKLGPVYQVVANAGITHDNFFIKLKPDDWMQ